MTAGGGPRAWFSDSGLSGALTIAVAMLSSYAFAFAVYLAILGDEIGFVAAVVKLPTSFLVLHLAMAVALAGIVAVNFTVRVRRTAARPIIVALLWCPFVAVGLGVFEFPLTMLICVPSTAFGLWAVHRMQRFRRIPVRLLLAVFGWGALVATGFAAPVVHLFRVTVQAILVQIEGLGITAERTVEIRHEVAVATMIFAGVWEELAKAAGVAVVLLLLRRQVDGLVTGLVLGAACGLGVNFVETVAYMTADSGGAAHQYFMRQSIGLLAAHTAFAALAGAGIGAARQLTAGRARVITGGLVAAAGGHMASNVLFSWYGQNKQEWFDPSPLVDALVLQPVTLILLQGPFVVAYLVLLHKGLGGQAGGLGRQLAAEARAGTGTVAPVEVPMLLSPARRLWLKVVLLRRHGLAAWRNTSRLHAAQLALATARWHLARLEADPLAEGLDGLRERVRSLKRRQAAIVGAARPRPVRVAS
ncbi:PrsW family glutamic-type intramembrane protease [Actinoplanes sp. NPDC051346]|uniref:PrsW family glutamic-type intramembrane protease n=1 Tax=Actinoplanes sp. NPDC051346 TaxID=3155048 RepID=UPI00343FBCB5